MVGSIVEYIHKAANEYGSKYAYIDSKNKVTFGEVNTISSAIATKIVGMGFFNKPILVLSERTIYTPISYLGVAKSGNFYIPIDSTLNINRINQIISVADAELMIISQSFLGYLDKLEFKGKLIVLEELIGSTADDAMLVDIRNRLNCDMPLYVIFTSGSTGKPKGVITSHLSLINYIDAVNEVLQLTEDDVLGNQSPLDYIAAIRDIYLPLFTGATTVIISKNEFAMASDLAKTLESNKITVLCWSAAGLEMGCKSGLLEEVKIKNLRRVLFSGSILPGNVLKEWQECFPKAMFINQYGPTEATASCTCYVVKEKADDTTILPIGTPYKNYGIVLLNEDGSETKKGNIGEICVSGLGVTLGYYGNKEMTDKSFIQNPLNDKYREIIYKTGDLGKYNDDGMLFFCGRKDRQIKHMGHRIELEEIELCAKSIEGINECVAVYDDIKAVLYLIYSGTADKKTIIIHYRETMPSFMVPRKVIQIDEVPHLPNGKIDVKSVKELVM